MAVHLSIGRLSSISLLALLALAAGTAQYLSRPEPATAPASQIAAVPSPTVPGPAVPSSSALEPVAAGTLPGSPAETATRHGPGPALAAERATPELVAPELVAPELVATEPVPKATGAGDAGAASGVRAASPVTSEPATPEPMAPELVAPELVAPEPAASEPAPPQGQTEIASWDAAPWEAALPAVRPPDRASPPATPAPTPAVAGTVPDRGGAETLAETLAEARPAPRLAVAALPPRPDPTPETDTLRTAPAASFPAASLPAASSPADARADETGSATAPTAAPQGRITVTRLGVARHGSPGPRDLAASASRPRNMAPIPTRAPRAAVAGSVAVHRAAMLFRSGAEIRIRKDANLYITARNIPDDDRLLAAYNAERPNGGRVRTRFGEATAVPGLLGIANQAHRAQDPNGRNAEAYSLADAMRDAIWRKTTAARLKSLTIAQNACAEGVGDTAKRTPSIGLAASC